MSHVCRLSLCRFHVLPGLYVARSCSSSRPNPSLEPTLIVFDAPSKPSEHRTRRSAPSPHSLSDYYSTRRLTSYLPAHVRSAASTSTSTASFLNSVSHPIKIHPQTFDRPSKPREYYVRPQPKRDLPQLKVRSFTVFVPSYKPPFCCQVSLPLVALLTALGLSAWGAFIFYATNLERLSSSVVRQLSINLRATESVKEMLGDDVKPEGKWWLGGEPWIEGAVHIFRNVQRLISS